MPQTKMFLLSNSNNSHFLHLPSLKIVYIKKKVNSHFNIQNNIVHHICKLSAGVSHFLKNCISLWHEEKWYHLGSMEVNFIVRLRQMNKPCAQGLQKQWCTHLTDLHIKEWTVSPSFDPWQKEKTNYQGKNDSHLAVCVSGGDGIGSDNKPQM